MPFLPLGGAEKLLNEIVRHRGRTGYRIVVVTTVAVSPNLGDATEWFERTTTEIFHLPRCLPERHWQALIDYLIEAKQIDVLWLAGSIAFHDALPRIVTIILAFASA